MNRLHRIIERFTSDHGIDHAQVEVHLFDGTNYRLAGISAEPGFGFLTLSPIPEEGDPPLVVVVPVGALRAFEVSAPDIENPLGFAAAETAPSAEPPARKRKTARRKAAS